jgi:hypothetical protein
MRYEFTDDEWIAIESSEQWRSPPLPPANWWPYVLAMSGNATIGLQILRNTHPRPPASANVARPPSRIRNRRGSASTNSTG